MPLRASYRQAGMAFQEDVADASRFVEALQCMQGEATIAKRLGKVRPHRERAVVARQRLLKPLQRMQGVATIAKRFGIVRPQRERAVVLASASSNRFSACRVLPRLQSAPA